MNATRFLLRLNLILLCSLLIPSDAVHAHKASDSYLRIRGGESTLHLQWDIAIKDLELLIGVDDNRDGDVTWAELKSHRAEIFSHALQHLTISVDGTACQLTPVELMFTRHSDGGYAVLDIATDADGTAETIEIAYDLLFDLDPTHRGLVLFENDSASSTHVLRPDRQSIEIDSAGRGLWQTFAEYTREGVWHIWIGFDHILFLISLLLPAVYLREERKWKPVESFWPACKTVLKIVTVFTLAHSITLWLAVMQYVTLPSQFVEATIAFSIIVTALNNLFPVFRLSGWVIAFLFGLVHGFGFANVLVDLGLPSTTLAIALFGFNVGVELGQLAIVLVFLPIAFAIRGTQFYRWGIFFAGSVAITIIAAIWLIERVGNVEILGF